MGLPGVPRRAFSFCFHAAVICHTNKEDKNMERNDFIDLLKNKKYQVTEENGIVFVIAKREQYKSVISEIAELVREKDYRGSFGVRMQQEEKG